MPTQFELIQQVRTIRATIDTFINTAERFPVKSRELSLCRTDLQRAKHFLGLYLSLCMEAENPYPNSSDSTNTIIEPQAEHNNFDLFGVFNELGCDDEHVKMVKEFRQQIENCFNHYFDNNFILMAYNYQRHECKIIHPTTYFHQSFLALKEAKMWLGWELDRIRKENETKEINSIKRDIENALTSFNAKLDEIHDEESKTTGPDKAPDSITMTQFLPFIDAHGDYTTANQVIATAKMCHEMNRIWCEAYGDHSQVRWEIAPEWQQESAIKGVRFALKNPDAPISAQHDAWMADKIADGWVYGEVKDAEKKTHPCIVPFDQLPIFQQKKDEIFRKTVKVMSTNFCPTAISAPPGVEVIYKTDINNEVKQPDNFVNNLMQKVNPESKVFSWAVSTNKDIENGEIPVYGMIFVHAKNLQEARIKVNAELPEVFNVERLATHINLSKPFIENVPFHVWTESYTHNKEQIEKLKDYKDKTDLN